MVVAYLRLSGHVTGLGVWRPNGYLGRIVFVLTGWCIGNHADCAENTNKWFYHLVSPDGLSFGTRVPNLR